MKRFWGNSAAICLVGLLVFIFTRPSDMREGSSPYLLTGVQARLGAVAFVEDTLGVDLRRVPSFVSSRNQNDLERWRLSHSTFDFAEVVSSRLIVVAFPTGQRPIRVSMTLSGRLVGLSVQLPAWAPGRGMGLDLSFEQREKLAAKLFERLAIGKANLFRSRQNGPDLYLWETDARNAGDMHWEVLVRFDANRLQEASLRPIFPGDFGDRARREAQPGGGFERLQDTLRPILSVIAALLVLTWWIKGQLLLNRLWRFLVFFLLFEFVTAGQLHGISGAWSNVLFFAIMALRNLGQAMVVVAGDRLVPASEAHLWSGMRLALRGAWRSRISGQSVWRGIAFAPWLAALPGLIVACGFPVISAPALRAASLAVEFPALTAWSGLLVLAPLATFGFLLPVFLRIVRNRNVAMGTAGLTGLVVAAASPFLTGLTGTLAFGALVVALLFFVYEREGLLAALVAAKFAAMLPVAAALLSAIDSTHRTSGGILVVSMAVVAGIAKWISAKGRDVDATPEDSTAGKSLSAKELLKEQFTLAQAAQQRMLPQQSPVVEGFSFYGWCKPAKDVGGDLFDYFPLAGNRMGVCVADVSGKGLPASLYMTFTKGVIAGICQERSGLEDLVRNVNRHLYETCRRQTFVTAAFASVEPGSRVIEHVRAGHNPILWYQAATSRAAYLNPPGVGLGLAGPSLFNRGTAVHRLNVEAGDVLVFYSDGVTEAMNERLELFGEDRLRSVVERYANGDASQLLERIRTDLQDFTGTEPPHDDVTIVILRVEV